MISVVVNRPHFIEMHVFIMSTVIITGRTTLRVLDVGGNLIGDKGMSMILEELQHNNSLTELHVVHCRLSAKGQN